MNASLATIARQIEALQVTLQGLVAQEAAAVERLVSMPPAEELCDDDLFAILRVKGLEAYKSALRRRNRQRSARLRACGRL